jgi:riboflavin biosynthesis pyrimidine reductase
MKPQAKPHVTCHMLTSIDGRILNSRWTPKSIDAGSLFETLHDQLGCDAWIVGRVTGQEFSRGKSYPETTSETFPRDNHIVAPQSDSYGIVLDAHGKIAWARKDIGGDPIITVLTKRVSDAHLAGLRADSVSYIFAGDDTLDLAQLLETLSRDLGVKRVLLEGGGVANGEFLRAGLVDELSIVICPVIDGAQGAPSVFDSRGDQDRVAPPLSSLQLVSTQTLDNGAVWLRYACENRG